MSISTLFGDNFSIGAYGIFKNTPQVDTKDRMIPLPYLNIETNNYYIDGTEIGYKTGNGKKSYLSLHFNYNFDGWEMEKTSKIYKNANAGFQLDKRDDYLSFGFTMYDLTPSNYFGKLTMKADVTGVNSGFTGDIELGRNIPLMGRLILSPYIGIEYMSENYTDYYYGITENEANGLNTSYSVATIDQDGKLDNINYKAGTNFTLYITRNLKLFGSFEYKYFGSAIKSSVLLDSDNTYNAKAGILYSF